MKLLSYSHPNLSAKEFLKNKFHHFCPTLFQFFMAYNVPNDVIHFWKITEKEKKNS